MNKKLKAPNIRIELRFMGDDFNPDIITNSINLKPSKSWRKGISSKKYDCWLYTIEKKECYTDEILWEQFFKIFNCKRVELRKLIDELHLDVSCDVVVEMPKDQAPGINIEFKIIKLICDIKGEIDIDLYVIS